MKVLTKNQQLCIGCGVCEQVCSKAYFKENNREKSSIKIEDKKIRVCSQCGVCIDICPTETITRDKRGIVRIDKKDCVGCFMCVGFCPEEAMMMHDELIEPFKCIACGLCAKQCPTGAIKLENIEVDTKEMIATAKEE
ncbi:4Fe-4S binding protein [Wukongibacter sp. M2B1]|uniref:4Fe-4S binding protein n=1 Tax=Wukongibacter sp. M2B1 TaxID=3088895 RepID=UPI003D7ADFCE